jgi:hypothetical protein
MNFWARAAAMIALCAPMPAIASLPANWVTVPPEALVDLDDDVARNIATIGFFNGIRISEVRISENGFDWHLLRFSRMDDAAGPNWVVPHDDENAAYDAMIAALRQYGGVGIAVNTGPGSARRQAGLGVCGVRAVTFESCDPNRNFDARAPLYTETIVAQFAAGRPIIALHTNGHGFSGDGQGGRGDVTILDRDAYMRGQIVARAYGRLAVNVAAEMDNADTLALAPFLANEGGPSENDNACGLAMSQAGIHFWHEPVRASDGSLSNYLAINQPDLAYVNAESRVEIDLAVAVSRHGIMIAAYLNACRTSGNQPTPKP